MGRRSRKSLDEARLIIQELSQLVIDLAKCVEQLEEERDLHSGNSSKPPSQESPKQRAQRKKKRSTGRNQGAHDHAGTRTGNQCQRLIKDEAMFLDIPEPSRYPANQ